ncbi:MAG: HEAT repeat domain-containing protein [Cyanobacteria bacterium P01_F01_bin.150]
MFGTEVSREAIEVLLGEEFFAHAVDWCIHFDKGWGLAEGVLRILRPLGMKHCYNIYKTSNNLEERQQAVALLKYTSNRRVLDYLPEFLADPDPQRQRLVIEILDQMLFWEDINNEDILPLLETAINHPNDDVRKFALGTVKDETIQGMDEFTKNLADALEDEILHWQKCLRLERIHGFALHCIPWYGQLKLSFLTGYEDFSLSEAYSEEYYYSDWRLNDLPTFGTELEALGQWMKKEFEKSGTSFQYLELFLSACASALKAPHVQNSFHIYDLSKDFQITVFSPNSVLPKRNFY